MLNRRKTKSKAGAKGRPSRYPRPFPAELSLLSPEALVRLVLSRYDLRAPVSCRYFARGLNDTYKIETGTGNLYLRIYRRGRQSVETIEGEIELLYELKSEGLHVALPLGDRLGKVIQPLEGLEGPRPAVLFEEAPGELNKSPDFDECKIFGRTLARIHEIADARKRKFIRPPINTPALISQPLRLIKPFLTRRPEDYERLAAIAKAARYLLKGLRRYSPEYGLCHGDLHARNAHFSEGQISLFDFDCSGYGWRAFDLASFLWSRYSIEGDRTQAAEARFRSFLAGYAELRVPSDEERGAIPLFVLLRELWGIVLHVECSRDWGEEVFHESYWRRRLDFIFRWSEDFNLLDLAG